MTSCTRLCIWKNLRVAVHESLNCKSAPDVTNGNRGTQMAPTQDDDALRQRYRLDLYACIHITEASEVGRGTAE
jgi:hypothetical protein